MLEKCYVVKADIHNLQNQFTVSVEKDNVIACWPHTVDDFSYAHFMSKARFAS